eukprot:366337-Chlamydomonas_euryale.AAC.13
MAEYRFADALVYLNIAIGCLHQCIFRDEEKVSPGFNYQSYCSGVNRCWTMRLTGTNSIRHETDIRRTSNRHETTLTSKG